MTRAREILELLEPREELDAEVVNFPTDTTCPNCGSPHVSYVQPGKRLTFLSWLLLPFAIDADAQLQPCSSATGRTVTVSGSATLRLVPDRVSFSVGVETLSASVGEAFDRNTEKVNAVTGALKQRGVKPEEIQSSNFSISSRDELGNKLPGYRVANSVTVTREDPSSLGKLLQAAVEKGANEAGSLQCFVSNQREAELRGLDLAFQNARSKAEKLAMVAGKTLGEAICVSEQGFYPAINGMVAESITVSAAAPSIETGTQQLSFRVGAVFELK